jgi:hypothetical protein
MPRLKRSGSMIGLIQSARTNQVQPELRRGHKPNGHPDGRCRWLAGDYTGDRRVDSADFIVWRKGLAAGSDAASNAPETAADDYLVWAQNFGRLVEAPSDTAASQPTS